MRPSGSRVSFFPLFFFSFLSLSFSLLGCSKFFLASIAARFLVTFLLKNHFFEPSQEEFPLETSFSFFLSLMFVIFVLKKTCVSLLFFFFLRFFHSGRSKVTRATVGRDTDQPSKVWEFVKLILRPLRSQITDVAGQPTSRQATHFARISREAAALGGVKWWPGVQTYPVLLFESCGIAKLAGIQGRPAWISRVW